MKYNIQLAIEYRGKTWEELGWGSDRGIVTFMDSMHAAELSQPDIPYHAWILMNGGFGKQPWNTITKEQWNKVRSNFRRYMYELYKD